MEKITSPSNPRIKQIRKLRERKEREQTGLFWIEGLRIVAEAIQQQAGIQTLVVSDELLASEFGRDQVRVARDRGIQVLDISAELFKQLSAKDGPQGIAAVVEQKWYGLKNMIPAPDQDWIALDAAQDPGNVGTILRTHDAVGGAGVILLDQSTDPFDSACVRASMGAIFSQRLVKTSFAEFDRWRQAYGIPVIGTSDAAAQDYHAYQYPHPMVLLMGSERQGLQERHTQICEKIVSIPMMGQSDSLNLAVATGIVLYEIFNQRREMNQIEITRRREK